MAKNFLEVKLYPKEFEVEDQDLGFVIVVSRYKDKWVFVQHKERDEWELPGWHRENWESILDWAKRELWEETGAVDYDIEHWAYWSLIDLKWKKVFWAIFFAEIENLWDKPESEIAKVEFFDDIPKKLTYPNVHQPIYEMIVAYCVENFK